MARLVPEQSPSVMRMLTRARPRWRGVSHRWAFVVSVPAGVVAIALAKGSTTRLAVASFSVGTSFMFAVSAMVHRRRWPAARYHRLIQLDHTAIYVCIALHGVGIGLLTLHGTPRVLLVSVLLIGAVVGVGLEWLPFHPPRGLMNALFLTLGWFPVVLLPWIYRGLDGLGFVLLLIGGACYTVGAIIVGAMKPDPAPEVFGYHEIWHGLVIAAVVAHSAMVWRLAELT